MRSDDLITIDPEILGGAPVFKGTRVPVKTLFEYLDNDYQLKNSSNAFLLSVVNSCAEFWNVLNRRYSLPRHEDSVG